MNRVSIQGFPAFSSGRRHLRVATLAVFAVGVAMQADRLGADEPVRAELLADAVQVAPGEVLRVGVRLEIDDGWYIYGKDPGVTGLPTEVDWELPEDVEIGDLEYPEPERFEFEGEPALGYSGEVLLTATLKLPEEFEGDLALGAAVSWLACSAVCIPGEERVGLTVSVGGETVLSEVNRDLFGAREEVAAAVETDEAEGGVLPGGARFSFGALGLYLIFGFLGGLLLNFMPCVLPVIGVKIMSVVKSAGDQPRAILLQGWMYTAGIVVSFWILAAVVIVLQAAGQALGQGFQFQHLPFLVFVTALIFGLALSMLGVFSVNLTSGSYQKASELSGRKGLTGAFFTGFVVTAVATPCTAPFLGAAMGFAFVQPALVTVAVFTAVGLGLAFPFTVLAHKPEWLRFLPKPGMWMEYFKQAMGFLMLGAVVWLLWVINLSQGGDAVVWTTAFLFVLALAAWVYGTFGNPAKSRPVRRWAHAAVLVLLAAGVAGILEGQMNWRAAVPQTGSASGEAPAGEGDLGWVDFTPDKLEELLETDQPVFVNFTAAWCLSCKANERTSIEIDRTRGVKKDTDAIFVYGDWTNQNPEIASFLRKHNRAGVPLYLVYGKDRENPQILPEILTPGIMERALRQAAESFEGE